MYRYSGLQMLLLALILGLTMAAWAAPTPYYRTLPAPRVLYFTTSPYNEGVAEVLRHYGGADVTFVTPTNNDQTYHHLCDKPLEETKEDMACVDRLTKEYNDAVLAQLDKFTVVIASFTPKDDKTFDMQRKLVDYVRKGGNLVFVNPFWEIYFAGTPLADVLPVKDGTGRNWTGSSLGATDHPLTRGLPFEITGSHFYGPLYEPYDDTCMPLTLNVKDQARFWYRKLPGGGQTVFMYQMAGEKWNWGSGENYASYQPERPDDAAVWQAFYPRLLYWLAYGAKAFPALARIALPEGTSAQSGARLTVPVEVENFTTRDQQFTAVLAIAPRRAKGLALTQKVTVKAGEKQTVVFEPLLMVPCVEPNLLLKAQVLDAAGKAVYGEASTWVPFASRVPLLVKTPKAGYRPGEQVPVTVAWDKSAQPGAYALQLLLVDNTGRVLRQAGGNITVAAGEAGEWTGQLVMPDWGPGCNSCYWVTAVCMVKEAIAGLARAQVQQDRPWDMRSQFQWSLWTGGGSPRTMALRWDAGFNSLGYPGSTPVADRYAMRQYVEGTGINTFSVTVDYDNWDAVRAAMEKTIAGLEKSGPDTRSKALVSLGEESGFEGGWGTRYYWKTDRAPVVPQKVFDDYLSARYNGDIARLNEEWGANYRDFSEIPFEKSKVRAPATAFMSAQAWEGAQNGGKPVDRFPVEVKKLDPAQKYMALSAPFYETNNFFDWYYQKYCDLATEVYRAKRNPVPLTIMSAPGGFYPTVDVYNFAGVGPFYPKDAALMENAIARRDYGDKPGFSAAMWAYFDLRSLWNSVVMSTIIAGNTHMDYWVDTPLTFNPDNTHTRASFWTKALTQQLHAIEPILLHKKFAYTKGLGMYIPPQPVGKGVIGGHFNSATSPNAPLYSALEESGYLPKVVKTDDLANINVLFASYAQVVSPQDGKLLADFVRNGGTLVATPWLGSCSPHGNVLTVYPAKETGLADLLGVEWLNTSQEAKNEPVAAKVDLPGLPELPLLSKGWDTPRQIADDVKVLAAYKDGTPLLLKRTVGKGTVYSLNMVYDWSNWWASFHEPGREAYRKLIEAIIKADGRVKPEYYLAFTSAEPSDEGKGWWGMVMKTKPEPGESIPWWSSQLYSDPNGVVKYLGIFADHRSPRITAQINWNTPEVHFIDMLTGRMVISQNGKAELTLPPGGTALWAVVPGAPVYAQLASQPALQVQAPAKVTAGGLLPVALTMNGPAKAGLGAVIDVYSPSGARLPELSPANITVTGGKATVEIPTALNDAPGAYRIVATDSLTHAQATAKVTLAAPAGTLPDRAVLEPFPHNPGEDYPAITLTDDEFLGALRAARAIYTGTWSGLEAKYMLSYYLYVPFRPANRHAIMRWLQRTDWTPHLAAVAATLRAGERITLTGEDLNVDPQTGLHIDPLAVGDPAAFLNALAKEKDAKRATQTIDGIRFDVITLGTGRFIAADASVDRAAYHSTDFVKWHEAFKAALAKVK